VPDDLAKLLKQDNAVPAAWKTLRPSLKREHVKLILAAKKPETRARRFAEGARSTAGLNRCARSCAVRV
jgi:uncharacterized protein YdeI (YjbR/CyaY-like superfamily)